MSGLDGIEEDVLPVGEPRARRLIWLFGGVGIVALVAIVVSIVDFGRSSTTSRSETGCSRSSDAIVGAATNGDVDTIRSTIANHADFNKPDDHGYTALYCAVWAGQKESASVLLDAGANPNLYSTDWNGTGKDLPLRVAIEMGHSDLVTRLITGGADVNAVSHDHTPLDMAIGRNDPGMTLTLLEHGADPNRSDNAGTPLAVAVADQADPQFVVLLVDHGADINAHDPTKNCPDLAKSYAANRADVHGCDTAIGVAAKAGNAAMVTALLDQGANPTAGIYAASVGNHIEVARTLLDRGADANGSGGTTPVLYNALFDNQDLLDLLLSRGADPNNGGPADATFLQLGTMLNFSSNLSPDQKTGLKHVVCALNDTAPNLPPLTVVATMGYPSAVKSLLSHGADPNAVAAFRPSITPILAAGVAHHDDVTALLLKAGAPDPGPTEIDVLQAQDSPTCS